MYYLTKKHLSRRLALKGLGVTVGLPLLDAMVPAATALSKTAAAPKLRVGFFYIPHGAIMFNTTLGPAVDKWTCGGAGADFKLSYILEPLEKYKRYVSSFGNLENAASAGSVHTINPSTWLSCVRPDPTAVGAKLATTVDQIIASRIGQDTPLPSLEVASETTIQAAACNGAGGACYYSSTVSFRNATSPLPMEYNPHKVFIELFGEGDTAEERAVLVQQQGSILDLIADRTQALAAQLGPADRAILSNHLEAVREIERRLQKAQSSNLKDVKLPNAPPGELDSFDEQVKIMFDLIALAYQANLTRVASYIMVAEGTNRTYNHIGVSDAFHPLSHHANDPDKINRLVKIQRYHLERFADFIGKIAAIKEGEGSALDNAIFLYGSNMSNSDRHNNYPLPAVLVGGGAGKLKGGQFVNLPAHTPLANLHLTVLNKAGVQQERFADSTGLITQI
jgi:hypothetical protein